MLRHEPHVFVRTPNSMPSIEANFGEWPDANAANTAKIDIHPVSIR
jgi:hypothetical protein